MVLDLGLLFFFVVVLVRGCCLRDYAVDIAGFCGARGVF